MVILYFIVQKRKKNDFKDNTVDFLRTVREARVSGKIDSDLARTLVADFAKTVSSDLMEDNVGVQLLNAAVGYEEIEHNCGVCGKLYATTYDKCTKCKLNCHSWKEFLPDKDL